MVVPVLPHIAGLPIMLVSDNPTYELFGVDFSVDEYDILIVNKIFFFVDLAFSLWQNHS
jgi:hypothetical protein